MKKLIDTIKFYYAKIVRVIDSAIENVVKTIEVTLAKAPKAIEDAYNLIIANLNTKNAILLVLVYQFAVNAKAILANWILTVIWLASIAVVEGSLKIK